MTTPTGPRHIPNDFPTLFTLPSPRLTLLKSALEKITTKSPPQPTYDNETANGSYVGPTGIAYLFLHVSAQHPELEISGHDALHWAKAYIAGDRGELELKQGNCGLVSEKLCSEAVRMCINRDLAQVEPFVAQLAVILEPVAEGEKDPFPSEPVYGRAGSLYLLRMIRHWIPESAPLVEPTIAQISERIMAADNDGKGNWVFFHKRYIGAGHGDVGIILQLVLTTPSLAPRLQGKLEHLLDLQRPNGNFPKFDTPPDVEEDGAELVQWCHGAPGFVQSLQLLRQYYPILHERIDEAIVKAREVTWKLGLLRKEPNMCHGTFGNALTFPVGPKREHFLAIASEENLAKLREDDPTLFATAAYGSECSLTMNYDPSSAWMWMVCDTELARYILYSDI